MVLVLAFISIGFASCTVSGGTSGTTTTTIPQAIKQCGIVYGMMHCFVGWSAPSPFSNLTAAYATISEDNPAQVEPASTAGFGGASSAFLGIEATGQGGGDGIIQMGWIKGTSCNGVYFNSPEYFTEYNNTSGAIDGCNIGIGSVVNPVQSNSDNYRIYSINGSSWALEQIDNLATGPESIWSTYSVNFTPDEPDFTTEQFDVGDYVAGTQTNPVTFSDIGHATNSCGQVSESPASGELIDNPNGAGNFPNTQWNNSCTNPNSTSFSVWDLRG